MATGTLIGESIRPGTTLDGVPITVNRIERVEPTNISDEQLASGIPTRWTLLFFEVDDDAAPALADAFAAILDEPGWYVDFHTAGESFVVYAGEVCRYPKGDAEGLEAAKAVGRRRGVPEAQLDWA